MEHYKIIHNEFQVKRFYGEVLPRLGILQVYFISLSARNKYLTDEERKFYDLGRTEMFAKTIIRNDSFDEYIKHIRRLECDVRGYTTRNGNPIPNKCMVCYANICPSSVAQSISKFQTLLAEYNLEALQIISNGNEIDNFVNRTKKLDNNLLNYYQNSHISKEWLDIDIDVLLKTAEDQKLIVKELSSFGMPLYEARLVETKSGYHLLLRKRCLERNPRLLIEQLEKRLKVKEVGINPNEMIPMPGTYQGNFEVKFLDF